MRQISGLVNLPLFDVTANENPRYKRNELELGISHQQTTLS